MASDPAAGILQTHFLKEQTTYDTTIAYAATDAVQGLVGTFAVEPMRNFAELEEAVGTASHQGDVALDQGGKFSGTFLIKPAAAGTAPDIGPAGLKAGFGIETITGSTSAVYTFSDTVKTPLQGAINIASNLQRTFSGGVVEEMVIEIPAHNLPTISLSGSFARMGWVHEDVNSAAEPQGETSIAVADASRGCVGIGGVVQFENDNNSNAGFIVTAVDWTAGAANFTISPGIAEAAGIGSGETITGLVPSQTTGGTAIAASNCGFTVDGIALGFTKLTIKVTTGWGLRDNEATSDRPTGIIRKSKRKVEGSIDFVYDDLNTGYGPILGRTMDGFVRDLFIRAGSDTAAARMKIDINKARLDVAQLDIGAEAVTGTMNFVARQNAAAADEMILTFD